MAIDPKDAAAFFRKVNEMGTQPTAGSAPKPPPYKHTPIVPGGPLPAPTPQPELVTPQHAGPLAAAAGPSPELVELVKLYQQLEARDQQELLWLARIKLKLRQQK